jgi:hypothetical protein
MTDLFAQARSLQDFNETSYARHLLAHFDARIADPTPFALKTRVLLVRSPDGIGIDRSVAALPFEQSAIARVSNFESAPGLPAGFTNWIGLISTPNSPHLPRSRKRRRSSLRGAAFG